MPVFEGTFTNESCTIFNPRGTLRSLDPYSIITIETKALNVDHVILWNNFGKNAPSFFDAYTQLIYFYRSSGLVTILGCDKELYSTNLHTHYRTAPPQYIWIKYDSIVLNATACN